MPIIPQNCRHFKNASDTESEKGWLIFWKHSYHPISILEEFSWERWRFVFGRIHELCRGNLTQCDSVNSTRRTLSRLFRRVNMWPPYTGNIIKWKGVNCSLWISVDKCSFYALCRSTTSKAVLQGGWRGVLNNRQGVTWRRSRLLFQVMWLTAQSIRNADPGSRTNETWRRSSKGLSGRRQISTWALTANMRLGWVVFFNQNAFQTNVMIWLSYRELFISFVFCFSAWWRCADWKFCQNAWTVLRQSRSKGSSKVLGVISISKNRPGSKERRFSSTET